MGAIIFSTFSIAFKTPFPWYLFWLLSLNSFASKLPVDAPEGTEDLKEEPLVLSSTSSVGFPLESIISLALRDLTLEVTLIWRFKDSNFSLRVSFSSS